MHQSTIKKNIKNIKNRVVFLRVDFNVPIKDGKIIDDQKIVAVLPTIRFLLRYKAKIVLATHLGRPNGKTIAEYSIKPLVKRLNKLLGGNKVKYIDEIYGPKVNRAVLELDKGEILFIENLRYNKGEEKNSSSFARHLVGLADVYINEAFSVTHRKHASVCAIKRYIDNFNGPLLEKELRNLDKIKKPARPLVVMLGGSKIATKISLINNLEAKASKILIGGALANNFLLARGHNIGKSLVDKKSIKTAKKLKNSKIVLPIDVVVLNGKQVTIRDIDKTNSNDIILDIGPETVRLFAGYLKTAKTIVWNGPLGMFEEDNFKHGTLSLARIVAKVSDGKTFGLVGGGETIEALKKAKVKDHVDWISTAGGAMLAYLGGNKMPGL